MNVILSCIMPLVYALFLWKKKNNNFDVIFISNEWSFVCFSPCETWIFFYLYKPNSILVQSFSLFFLWIRSKLLYLLVFSMLVKIIVSKTWVVLYIFLFFYLNWIFFYQGTTSVAHFYKLNFPWYSEIWNWQKIILNNRMFSEIWGFFCSPFALYYINLFEWLCCRYKIGLHVPLILQEQSGLSLCQNIMFLIAFWWGNLILLQIYY